MGHGASSWKDGIDEKGAAQPHSTYSPLGNLAKQGGKVAVHLSILQVILVKSHKNEIKSCMNNNHLLTQAQSIHILEYS